LKNLETLDIGETRITREAFERLKQALPRLKTEAAGPGGG
jgi:hypothetical protein